MTPGNSWRSRLGLALVCSSLFLVACGGVDGGNDSGSSSADDGASSAAAPQTGGEDSNRAALSEAGSGGGTAPSTTNQSSLPFDRKIVYTTSLSLTVPDVANGFNEIQRLVRVEGGYVEKSNLSVRSGDEERGPQSASLVLRVPVAGFDALLGNIRGLADAKVTREEASSNEVTEQYTDLSARLRNLQANEKQYLELLATAKTVNDILTLNDRLSGVREQIETVQGRLNLLDHMTEMATISVALSVPTVASQVQEPKGGGIASPAEAFTRAIELSQDGLRVLGALGAFGVVALAWAAPFVVIALVIRKLSGSRRVRPEPVAADPGA